jgi:hypothetical protein
VSVFIRNSGNLHYSIKENALFATTVFVSISIEIYIDIFPSFAFYADSPKSIWNGGCSNWEDYRIGEAPGGKIYDEISCSA